MVENGDAMFLAMISSILIIDAIAVGYGIWYYFNYIK